MAAPVAYEVVVRGRIDPIVRGALADYEVRVEPSVTVLSGTLDQAALHDLIGRIEAFGWELFDVRRNMSTDALAP